MEHGTALRSARDDLDARTLPVGVRRFLATEAAGGVVLVMAAVVALAWANSPWSHSYDTVWHTRAVVEIGPFSLADDLRHLVNDGLMALFFLVVALEIKRELVTGDLRDPRVAALPVVAAAGGMVVPALLYLAINAGLDTGGGGAGDGGGMSGWGIPIATDIAFAVGILALLGPRVPSRLQLFVLALAIVDDIGAIAVIAVAYTESIDLPALAVALGAIGAGIGLRAARVSWPPAFVVLGIVCWVGAYESGVHATLAGVAFGLLAPARPLAPSAVARRWADDLSDEPSAAEMRQLTTMAKETVSVAERVQHVLHPLVSFGVVPVFALANAGVRVSGDALSTPSARGVAAGVGVGLLVGKVVGITGASALAVRWGLARLPEDVGWSHMLGAACLAAIGFTISLFVTDLAFDDPALQDASRLAILTVSVVAALLGTTLLRRHGRPEPA